MATPEVISLVVDKIVAAFDGNVELFESFLARSRLTTEADALRSQMRVIAAQRDADVTTAETELQTLQAELTAKLAEIDAL